MTNAQVARFTVRMLLALFLAAVFVWPVDWAVWGVRMGLGGGMGEVEVMNLTAAELKGNKEEFYVDGSSTVPCSRSLFRQAGAGACWYLRRHNQVVTRY